MAVEGLRIEITASGVQAERQVATTTAAVKRQVAELEAAGKRTAVSAAGSAKATQGASRVAAAENQALAQTSQRAAAEVQAVQSAVAQTAGATAAGVGQASAVNKEYSLSLSKDTGGIKQALQQATASAGVMGGKVKGSLNEAKGAWKGAAMSAVGLGKAVGPAALGVVTLGAAFKAYSFAKGAVATTTSLAGATRMLQAVTHESVRTASTWVEVTKVRGIETQKLGMMFGTLSKNIRAADQGSKGAVNTFKQIGLSQQEVARSSPTEIIKKTADAFKSGLVPATQQAAVAQQLFGRSGRALLPLLQSGSEGINKQFAIVSKYHAYLNAGGAKTAKDFAAAQREQAVAVDGLKIALGEKLIPVLLSGTEKVTKFIGEMESGKGTGGRFAADMRKAADGVQWLSDKLGKVAGFLNDVQSASESAGRAVNKAFGGADPNRLGPLELSKAIAGGWRPGTLSASPHHRAGGVSGGDGVIPSLVSPGEMIVHGGGAMIVPGQPTAADNVLMGIPAGSAVLTRSGQGMLAGGASVDQAVRQQLPHFQGGGRVSLAGLIGLAKGARMSKPALAAAVAMGESGGNPHSQLVSNVEDSRGLWQINTYAHRSYDKQRLYDPAYNAKAAFDISSGGRQWGPWSVYTSGKYRQWYDQATRLSPTVAAGSSASAAAGTPGAAGAVSGGAGSSVTRMTQPAQFGVSEYDPSAAFQAGVAGTPLFQDYRGRDTDIFVGIAKGAGYSAPQYQTSTVPGTSSAGAPAAGGAGTSDPGFYRRTAALRGLVRDPSGSGHQVAAWIAPEIKWAMQHGWHGQITSGYRDYVPPGGAQHSEHMIPGPYPHGAIDFGGFNSGGDIKAAFFRAARGYPGPKLKYPIGFHDDGHASGTGHRRGGWIGGIPRYRIGTGNVSAGSFGPGLTSPVPGGASDLGGGLYLGPMGITHTPPAQIGATGQFMAQVHVIEALGASAVAKAVGAMRTIGVALQGASGVTVQQLERMAVTIRSQMAAIVRRPGPMTAAQRTAFDRLGSVLHEVDATVQYRLAAPIRTAESAVSKAQYQGHLAANQLTMSGAQQGTPAWQAGLAKIDQDLIKSYQQQIPLVQAALSTARSLKQQDPAAIAALQAELDQLTTGLSDAQVQAYQDSQATDANTSSTDANTAATESQTATLEAQNQLLQEQNGLLRDQVTKAKQKARTAESQFHVLQDAIAQAANRGLGGQIGLSRQTPGTAGRLAVYR